MDVAQKPVIAPHDHDDHHAEREKHPEQVPEIDTFPNPLGSFASVSVILCRQALPYGMVCGFPEDFPYLSPD